MKRRITSPARRGLLLALCLALSGCSALGKLGESVASASAGLFGGGKPRPAPPAWTRVTVSAAADANRNSPVALDLVFVRDPALLESLNATPAAKWFATREDTQRAFPEGLGVVSLELVPGQTVQLTDPAHIRQPALAVLAFASYPPPGEHRERLLPAGDSYLLQLGPQGFRGSSAATRPAK